MPIDIITLHLDNGSSFQFHATEWSVTERPHGKISHMKWVSPDDDLGIKRLVMIDLDRVVAITSERVSADV